MIKVMGQQEVYSFLERHKNNWFSSKELIEKLKLSAGSITTSLMKLRKGNLIYFESRIRTIKSGAKRKVYVYRFRK